MRARRKWLATLLVAVITGPVAHAADKGSGAPIVAYVRDEDVLVERLGKPPTTAFRSAKHIQSFAIDARAERLALVTGRSDDIGGTLQLVELKTGKVRTLLEPRPSGEPDRELAYACPDFSPSGDALAFLVRSQFPYGWEANDAAGTSGPIGIFNLKSGGHATLQDSDDSSVDHVRWSPDGKSILVDDLAKVGLVFDADGRLTSDLSFASYGDDHIWPHDWLGADCLYVTASHEGVWSSWTVDLRGQKTVPRKETYRAAPVVEVSGTYLLAGIGTEWTVYNLETLAVVLRFNARLAHIVRMPPVHSCSEQLGKPAQGSRPAPAPSRPPGQNR